MARNFTNENFEKFLQQSADGLRMRPSDKVWKGISKRLDKKRRRFGIGLGAALLITSATAYFLLNTPENTNKTTGKAPTASLQTKQSIKLPGQAAATTSTNSTDISSTASINTSTEQNKKKNSARPALYLPERHSLVVTTPSIAQVESATEDNMSFLPSITDDSFTGDQQKPNTTAEEKPRQAVNPLTIESVLNTYKGKHRSKLGLQIYFTPTVSYRKLTENKAYLRTITPGNLPATQQGLYDINNVVTHKPDFGFEIGIAAKYPILQNIKVRGGLQFNVNRYDIKVFNSATQLATITLSDRHSSSSYAATTTYNNFTGYRTNWLENFYFQVSAPVGVEAILKGDDKVKFGIASTIQPTYVLGDRAYLLSTDYKNYVEVPWLIRRWNVNTSLETFVSYSTGQLKWQVGPQVRYQLLSSFVKQYPVKENLFDFGLKVGIGLKGNQ